MFAILEWTDSVVWPQPNDCLLVEVRSRQMVTGQQIGHSLPLGGSHFSQKQVERAEQVDELLLEQVERVDERLLEHKGASFGC